MFEKGKRESLPFDLSWSHVTSLGVKLKLSLQRLRFTPPRGLDLSEEAGDTLCEVFCPTH